jgi:hypothetical protein
LLVEETGRLWLLEFEAETLRGRVVTRTELATKHPRLSQALIASDNAAAPRIVDER